VTKLTVNGTTKDVAASTAAALLDELGIARERVAVVLNEQVVRRAKLEETTLSSGDIVEIITMVGGG
jgi:sulfur carrier protein